MQPHETGKFISRENNYFKKIDSQLVQDRSPLALGSTLESVFKRFNELTRETYEHCQRVGTYSQIFAALYGVPEREIPALTLGARLHDIGKAAEVLSVTQPDQIQTADAPHQVLGFKLLKDMNFPPEVLKIVQNHHADDFKQADTLTNIVKLWDAFDTIVSGRFGSPTLPVVALQKLQAQFSSKFDPQLEEIFVSMVRRM